MGSLEQNNPSPNVTKEQLLFLACKSRDVDKVRRLLALFDLRVIDEKRRTALHLATRAGNFQAVLMLLEQPGHRLILNAQDIDGRTALMTVCKNNKVEIAYILLKYGANANVLDYEGRSALSIACIFSNEGVIDLLLRDPATDVNAHRRHTALHWAVGEGSDQIVKMLVTKAKYLNLDTLDEAGKTPLHLACMKGSTCKAKELIYGGADINRLNNENQTPLHVCCAHNYSNIAEVILKRCPQVNVEDSDGNSPLHVAIQNLSMQCVELLTWHQDTDLNTTDEYGRTPLLMACELNLEGLMCDLLKKEVDVNVADAGGNTPLHALAYNQNTEPAWTFLQHSQAVCLDARGPENKTALNIACEVGDLNMIRLLVEKGADVNVADDRGRTPLFWMCWYSSADLECLNYGRYSASVLEHVSLGKFIMHRREEIVDLLIEYNADVNYVHPVTHVSLLHVALYGDQEKIAEKLAVAISDVNSRDQYRKSTALAVAAGKGYVKVVTTLLQRGAVCKVPDDEGRTPLHHACFHPTLLHCMDDRFIVTDGSGTNAERKRRKRQAKIIKELLKANASLDAVDTQGCTPLHHAFESCNKYIARLLIRAGADLNVPNSEGWTALRIAAAIGDEKVMKMLEARGFDVRMETEDTGSRVAFKSENFHLMIMLWKTETEYRYPVLGKRELV